MVSNTTTHTHWRNEGVSLLTKKQDNKIRQKPEKQEDVERHLLGKLKGIAVHNNGKLKGIAFKV